jgi:putative hydrolase of the HAD superfamily
VNEITTLLFDIGGVVLTNGWDEESRKAAAEHFNLNFDEVEKRHNSIFFDFEKGNISLKEYTEKVIFYKKRDFSPDHYINFIKSRTKPYKSSFQILEKLSGLTVSLPAGTGKAEDKKYLLASINNESYELNLFRINHFKLNKYFTAFFSSSFLNMRKPEPLIYKTALNILHKNAPECLFIDDRIENIEEAVKQGFQTIHLTNVDDLKDLLIQKGIKI